MVLYSTQSIENPLTNVNKHSILRTCRASSSVSDVLEQFLLKSRCETVLAGEGLNPSVDGEAIPVCRQR